MVPLTAQLNWFSADTENSAAAAKFGGSGVYHLFSENKPELHRKLSYSHYMMIWFCNSERNYGSSVLTFYFDIITAMWYHTVFNTVYEYDNMTLDY